MGYKMLEGYIISFTVDKQVEAMKNAGVTTGITQEYAGGGGTAVRYNYIISN